MVKDWCLKVGKKYIGKDPQTGEQTFRNSAIKDSQKHRYHLFMNMLLFLLFAVKIFGWQF